MSKIFNPLTATASSQQSTSALYNEIEGQCPKCKQNMGTAQVADGNLVYYCEKCRVAQPLPNGVRV